ALEIEPKRNDGEPFFDDLTEEAIDFAPMQEQLPLALGIMVLAVPMAVGRDVRADEEGFAPIEIDVAVLQIHLPLPQRLPLPAVQGDSGFEFLQNEVVVEGLAIGGDHLLACIGFGHRSSLQSARMTTKKNIVHVVGTGTIGEPLIGLFNQFKDRWGIDEVTFHKRTPSANDRAKVNQLIDHGARLATD